MQKGRKIRFFIMIPRGIKRDASLLKCLRPLTPPDSMLTSPIIRKSGEGKYTERSMPLKARGGERAIAARLTPDALRPKVVERQGSRREKPSRYRGPESIRCW